RRAAEPLAVADLRRGDAPALLGLARAVLTPPGGLVEASRARVVLEHPQRRLVVVLGQPLLATLQQYAAGAGRPGGGKDVDGVQLADPPLVAAWADGREADHWVAGDERRPARRRVGEAPPPALGVDEVLREPGRREGVRVGD